jgi:ribosomal protein L24E
MRLRSILVGALVTATAATSGALGATVQGLASASPVAAAEAHDDMVWAFGSAAFRGSTQGMPLVSPVVGMAQTPDGKGYWLVAEDGGLFAFGAAFHGSLSGWPLRSPVAAMASARDGKGYWMVTEDGIVARFGSAVHYGDMGGTPLNAPMTDIVAAPDGKGYWLVAEDGGVFSFGSARFWGSTGGMVLNAPVVAMAPAADGKGYWLVAKDGGVFSFGSARFWGSTGGIPLVAPVIGIGATAAGKGYWLAAEDGGVFAFGDARFEGSAAGRLAPGRRVVQLVGMPTGDGYRMLALERPPDVALVGPGDAGPGVADLQRRLESMGYWTGGANGVYGPLTQQAVWAFQKVNGLGRTGVVDPATRAAFRTARRPLPRSTTGYVVEVDKARQVVIVARAGRAEWVFNTSTGTERPYTWEGRTYLADTPPGLWRVDRQVDGVRHGALGTLYRPKYFHRDGIAFHGYPSVPPYPASHGCVRLTNAAINWIWDNGVIPLGTAVWVY